jgi:ribonuclease HII
VTSEKKGSEKLYWNDLQLAKSFRLICGVDEVGRGPLAGPVAATAVIMDLKKQVLGVNDSKKLTAKRREELYPQIIDAAVAYKTVFVDHVKIGEVNILGATKIAMTEAVLGLPIEPDLVLVDAVRLVFPWETRSIFQGDATSYSIACASIIAKVERDRLMEQYHEQYPEYGFNTNKGYGTQEHIAALLQHGRTPIHREHFISKLWTDTEQANEANSTLENI